MRRPLAWAAVALVNLSAMTLFLWHQSAFLAVTMAGAMAGRLPGLLTAPSGALWIAERLAWLPVFAVALTVAWLLFHRFERRGVSAVGRLQPLQQPLVLVPQLLGQVAAEHREVLAGCGRPRPARCRCPPTAAGPGRRR